MSYVSVSLPQLLLSLGLMALAIAISARDRLGLEKDLVVGTIRAAVQLFLVGLLLTIVFRNEQPASVFGVIVVMIVVAGWTAARTVPTARSFSRARWFRAEMAIARAISPSESSSCGNETLT